MTIFLISFLAALIPIVVYVLFLRWLDRYEREPLPQILLTFLLGATISAGLSYVGNTILSAVSRVVMTQAGADYFSVGLLAPIIEETNKGLIVLMFAWLSREFDNVTDGILYGAVVGLGFAFSENILYFMRVYQNGGVFDWIHNMYLRGLFTTGLHASTTAIFGAAVAYGRHQSWWKKIAILFVGWGLAINVHSFWNSVLTAGSLSKDSVLSLVPFIGLPVLFFILFICFQFSLSRESRILEGELTEEAKAGVLPLEHVSYLKSYLARSKSGWMAETVKVTYIKLATDLAFLRNHAWNAPARKRELIDKELGSLRQQIKSLLESVGKSQKGGMSASLLAWSGFLGFFFLAFVGGYFAWTALLDDFPATKIAKYFVINHPMVHEKIGNFQEWANDPQGEFSYNEQSGHGQVTLQLVGDHGEAEAEVELVRDTNQPWVVSKATLLLPPDRKIELDTPQKWLNEANASLAKNNPDQAEKYCALIQKASPDDPYSFFCTAEVAWGRGDKNRYLGVYQSLAETNPSCALYQSKLAFAYSETGNWEKSQEHYTASWRLSKRKETAAGLADVFLEKKENERAREWLDEAVKAGMKESDLAYRYGRYFFNVGDYGRALEKFKEARALQPNSSFPYLGLAYVSRALGQSKDAIFYFEQGIARNWSNSLRHQKALVDLLLEMNYEADAVYHLVKMINYHPKDLDSYQRLAQIYTQQGRLDAANQILNLRQEKMAFHSAQ